MVSQFLSQQCFYLDLDKSSSFFWARIFLKYINLYLYLAIYAWTLTFYAHFHSYTTSDFELFLAWCVDLRTISRRPAEEIKATLLPSKISLP